MAKKQSKKKENKRRLLLLILLLVLTVTLIGGATYAWFTANTKVSIEAMQLDVTVANGIEISADAQNWFTQLKLTDLYEAAGMGNTRSEDAGSINQIPQSLQHLSTVGNVSSSNKLELFNGTATTVCHKATANLGSGELATDWFGVANKEWPSVEDGGKGINEDDCDPASVTLGLVKSSAYEETRTACADGGGNACPSSVRAVAFDVYLKTDEDAKISLAPGSYVKNSGKIDYGLKNTIRVAFVTLGTQPKDYYYADASEVDANGVATLDAAKASKPANQAYAAAVSASEGEVGGFGGYAWKYGARTMNGFGSISIWEPNALQHTAAGLANAVKYGKGTVTGADTTNGVYQVIPEDKLPIPYKEANDTDNSDYFAQQKKVYAEEVGTTYKHVIAYKQFADSTSENFELFTVPAGVTKVRVYIWVEGNDIDTENNATSSTIEAMISFTTATTTAEKITSSMYETYINTSKSGANYQWRTNVGRGVNVAVGGTKA